MTCVIGWGEKNESKKFICPVNYFYALGVSGCGRAKKRKSKKNSSEGKIYLKIFIF